MQKLTKIIFCTAVLLGLAVLAILTLFFPQTASGEYDVWENRRLAETPVLQISTVSDGTYFSAVENYLSDHLYGRQSFLTANVRYQQVRSSTSVNGVICADDVLLLDNGIYDRFGTTDPQDAETLSQRLGAVRDVTEQYDGVFLYIGLPTQRNVFADAYPAYAENDCSRTDALLSALKPALAQQNINVLFLEDRMAESGSETTALYSPVDHHFTLNGAIFACKEVISQINALGCEVPALPDDLAVRALPNPMLGTYNRKLYGCTDVTDQLLVYHTENAVSYERWDNGVKTDAPVIVLPQTETEYVQYTAYMGGDKAETIIKTNRPTLKKLLVVGDSFTNAMETVLYLSFDEMRSLDFRYYTEKTLSEYIADYQPDVVLFIRDASVCLTLDGNGNIQ